MTPTFEYREILKTLNSVGYSNISAAELKAFKKDLNALIKYESGNASKPNTAVNVQMPLCKECRGSGRTEILVNLNQMQSSNETSPKQEKENVDRHNSHEKNRPIVEIRAQERAQERAQQAYKNKYSRCAKSNSVFVKNTAIDLYRKYQHDWKKFKTNIPGENSREDLRKEVREKSLKQPPPKPTVYVYYTNGHKYIFDKSRMRK